jgi:hypothetical protein
MSASEEDLVDSAMKRSEAPSVRKEKLTVLDGEYEVANPDDCDSATYTITAVPPTYQMA